MQGDWLPVTTLALARLGRAQFARVEPVEAPREAAPLSLFRRFVVWMTLVAVLLQPTYAMAAATRALAESLAKPVAPSLSAFVPMEVDPVTRALWETFAAAPQEDDENPLNALMGLMPRNCTLVASPLTPTAGSTFLLTMTGCSGSPTRYRWSGPNIPVGQETTGAAVDVTAPSAAGTYVYNAFAMRGNIPSRIVSVSVTVTVPPPPVFRSFDPTPIAVPRFAPVSITFDALGQTSTQFFYGTNPVAPTSIAGNTYTLPSLPAEGVYRVRVVLANAGGSTEQSVLVAVSDAPAPDTRPANLATSDVGTIAGTLAVSDSGAATYTIPIQVPPGAAGLQPSLSLAYNSQAGDGLMGVGWTLGGLSSIHRCPKTIAQDGVTEGINYDADWTNDQYCLDGQRLIQVGSGTIDRPPDPPLQYYEYRTEVDSFSRIRAYVDMPIVYASPTRFIVWTKSGQVLGYASRFHVQSLGNPQVGAGRSNVVKVWPLDRVEDRVGNYLDIHYEGLGVRDQLRSYMQPTDVAPPQQVGAFPATEAYPTRIRYYARGTPADQGPFHEVVFNYTNRAALGAAPIRTFDSGAGLTTLTKVLTGIDTYIDRIGDSNRNSIGGTLVKRYNLAYALSPSTKRPRMTSVEECAGNGVCLPKSRFNWSDIEQRFAFSAASAATNGSDRTKLVDMNGDGRTDMALVPGAGVTFVEVSLSTTAAGSTTAQFNRQNWPLPGRVVPTLFDEIFADFNGDGLADLTILNSAGGGSFTCYTNSSGTGFASCKDGGNIPARTGSIRLWGDVDGNGQIDLLHYEGNGYWTVCLSNAPSHPAAFGCQYNILGATGSTGGGIENHVFVGDYNGDGRADLITRRNETTNADEWKVCFAGYAPGNTAQFRWICAQPTPAEWARAAGGDLDRLTVLDFNGDGLADMAFRDPTRGGGPGKWRVCLSAGDGAFEYFDNDSPIDPLSQPRCRFWNGPAKDVNDVQFGDFNGDGRTDLAVHASGQVWQIYVSTGTDFALLPDWGGGISPNSMPQVVAGDFNGDGRTDLAFHERDGNWSFALTSGFGDLMHSVITGLDAETLIGYAPLTNGAVYARTMTPPAAPELLIQSPLYVVWRTDAVSRPYTTEVYRTDYRYWDLKGHSQGRGMLGFRQREIVENVSASAAGVDASQRTRTLVTYIQSWPLAGQATKIERFAMRAGGTEVKVADTENDWGTRAGMLPRIVQVFQTQARERQWELDGVELPMRTTSTPVPSDVYGNVDLVTVSVDGHTKATVNTYANDPNTWILGRLTSSVVTHSITGQPPQTRRATFSYSGPSGDNCVSGLLCSESIEAALGGTFATTTTYAYDAFGNRRSATQSFTDGTPSRTTTTIYDAAGRFPVSVANALGHVEQRRHDPRFGGIACSLDPNGIKTLSTYDGFGRRVAQTTRAFAGSTNCDASTDAAPATDLNFAISTWGWISAAQKGLGYVTVTRSSGAADTVTTFDALQREVKRDVQAFESTSAAPRYATTMTGYDLLGRKRWMRTSTAGAGSTHLSGVVLDYDGRNRPVAETTLNANVDPAAWLANRPASQVYTTTTIVHGTTNIADENGIVSNRLQVRTTRTPAVGGQPQTTTRIVNSQGQVIRVVDAHDKATRFKHDAVGNLKAVTGPTNITVTMDYDTRGRKTSMVDPSAGSWSYQYNGAGEMTRQTDGRLWYTDTSYDQLGRMTQRWERNSVAALQMETRWTYDSCPRGVGKLCKTAVPEAWSRETAYDTYARPFRSTTVVGVGAQAAAYSSHTLYDRNSRVRIVAYPGSTPIEHPLNLRHEYNDDAGASGPGMVWRISNHFVGTTYWQTQSAASGRYDDGRFRTGFTGALATSRTYDVLGRIGTIQAGSVQSATYAFDALGNLTTRTDAAAGLTSETFGYDRLNRLISATTAAVGVATYSRSYQYDDAGNLTYRSDFTGTCGTIGALTYIAGTHRVNCADGRSYAHDANGNVTGDGLRSLSGYTPFNLPTTITRGTARLDYVYDGDHQRLKETVNGASTTTFVGPGVFEAVAASPTAAPTAWRHYIGTPEGTVAVVTRQTTAAEATRFWHRDHLGSVVAETDAAGGNVQRFSYDAWGKRRLTNHAPGDPTNLGQASSQRGFTGHEHLDEVGLVHMNGRIYDPSLGRFLQADPIIQEVLEPQNYNRYSYVLNNPLSYTDPSGFSFWKKWGRTIAAIVAAVFMQVYLMPAILGVAAGATMTTGQAFISSIASGFASGGIAGGNLQSALQGALSAAVFFGVGSIADGASTLGDTAKEAFGKGGIGRIGLHAAAGCATAAAAGGSCKQGALSAGFAQAVSPHIHTGQIAFDVAASAVAGGIASVLGGGKFQNGAVTAAFGHLFNCVAHECLAQGQDAEKTFTDYLRANADPSLQLGFNRWYDSQGNFFWGRPDIFSESLKMLWDVKPDSNYGWASGAAQVAVYTVNGIYAPGTGAPLFGTQESVTLRGAMNRYEYRFGASGLVIYRALDASPIEQALRQAAQQQTNRILMGPLPRRRSCSELQCY